MPTQFKRIVETLSDGGVDYVIIGGVALVAHGSARTTEDIDICYAREPANIAALAAALALSIPRCVARQRTCRSASTFRL